jgi:hypothetical protein
VWFLLGLRREKNEKKFSTTYGYRAGIVKEL